MSIDSGYRLPLRTAPLQAVIGILKNAFSFNRSESWSTWFNDLVLQFAQISIVGTLDFPNTAAQTSSAESTFTFTLTGPNNTTVTIPADSYITAFRLLDPATDLEVALPANSFFTYRMFQDNGIAVRFNNFSAGAIDPANFKFEFLVELRKA